MSKKIKSEGHCVYCNKIYSKGGLSRHLSTHLKKLEQAPPKKTSLAYHIRVEAGPFFLQLLMNGNKPLKNLDSFLRQIWLECCGHLSEFFFGRYEEVSKSTLAKQVFSKGVIMGYIYDWGSSTELKIQVINEYSIPMKESILLLSRNEPFSIPCDSCGESPVVSTCTIHGWDEDSSFCQACAEKHEKSCEDADYAMVDLCNSPRAGVCGYTGGSIDRERDTLVVSD